MLTNSILFLLITLNQKTMIRHKAVAAKKKFFKPKIIRCKSNRIFKTYSNNNKEYTNRKFTKITNKF